HTRFSRDWSSDVCSSDLKSAGHENDEEDRTYATDSNRLYGDRGNKCRESSARHERFVPTILRRIGTLRGVDKRPGIWVYMAPLCGGRFPTLRYEWPLGDDELREYLGL